MTDGHFAHKFRALPIALSLLLVIATIQTGSVQAERFEVQQVDVAATVGGQTTFQSVNFLQSYSAPPIVIGLVGNNGGDAGAIRFGNITTSGFEVTVAEPPNEATGRVNEIVNFLVIDPTGFQGIGSLAGQAATHATTTTVQRSPPFPNAGGFDNIALSGFSAAPAILAGIQSAANEQNTLPGQNSTPWITAQPNNITATDFDLALERAEVNDGNSVTNNETIGWVAVAQGSGSLTDNAGNAIAFKILQSPNNIEGRDDTPFQTNTFPTGGAFGPAFGTTPLVIATQATRNGADGGWIRYNAISPTNYTFYVDEDRFTDTERGHTDETASLFAFADVMNSGFAFEASRLTVGTSQGSDEADTGGNQTGFQGATSLDYGNVRIGSFADETLTATNTGTGTLSNVDFQASSGGNAGLFVRQGDNFGNDLIGNGDAAARDYRFSPGVRGTAFSTTATVNSDDAGFVDVGLSGNGVGPELFFATTDHDANATAAAMASIDNNGDATVGAGPHGTLNIGAADWVVGPNPITGTLTLTNQTPDGDLQGLTDLTILGFDAMPYGPDAGQFEILTDFNTLTADELLLEADGSDFLDIMVQFTADGSTPPGLKTAFFDVMTDQGAALGDPGANFTFQLQAVQTPEPTSIAIWTLLGLALLTGFRYRRMRR